ncbi:putrescine hydroxycinnamoyltransferase 1-like [Phragmites australis]|uniref:putrescine hydroxycinnamoyltransferase 1-like n=1 Tax=Phragmites australis TaxID=29695 RepID=UPI002D76CE1D|nr:putrescine hydroxycinnamoyltransferase 1-like [Phragmites australis]
MSSSEPQVVESSFVAPSEATPRKGLWLSPLDLDLANRGHTPTVYFYRCNDDAAAYFFDVAKLKEAMAMALVAFYPLAGRLDVDYDGRIEISCNGEGALFVVARSDRTVDDFNDFNPSPELRRLFVPHVAPSSIVMAVQVTFLKCGGVALGTALHHAVIDAMSAFHFFQTWSAFSRDGNGAAVELPCHDRILLRPRSPPVVHPDTLSVFYPKVILSESPARPTASRVFTISKDQVAFLKRGLCGGASTFCAVSALVWQCTCVARQLPPDAETCISFWANIRRSVRPPLPDRFFGNALVALFAAGAARDIASEALESVAGRIRGAIGRMDDELVRSAIDYYELAEMDSRTPKGILPETELRMVSWLGMPVYDVDFGWGKPCVMSRAESILGGYVYLMNDGNNDAVRVLMCMEAACIKEFERLLYAKL